MLLSEIKVGQSLTGVEQNVLISVVQVIPVGDAADTVIYKLPDGSLKERLVNESDAKEFSIATTERPWSFDGDGKSFKLAVEAKRIDLAFLFDPMMAIHTSNVEPLPHQITAVYESMLPRQPLRFVLADDPGAGKTIMAGLYIRELIMRADARRILVVAPGSLVEQWRDELWEKFGLTFRVFAPASDGCAPNDNVFEMESQLIVRLDQMSRNPDLKLKLCQAGWDLVIFDEAHKLAAHYLGNKLEMTSRFDFARELGKHTRHLLLMTATPHNGKEEDFQLFLSLLDSDRFYGRSRTNDAPHKVDVSDLMRRMIKEELVKFDGTPLFPERKSYTVNYKLSEPELQLYKDVTAYVGTEMGKADALGGSRKGSVGFALTALQRRLASSPEAIFQSLKRRKEKLERRLREAKMASRSAPFPDTDKEYEKAVGDDNELDLENLTADEQENFEEELIDQATAAQTVAELEQEIEILKGLEEQALKLRNSDHDRKWEELSKILQDNPDMHDADGKLRKLIIFTEHRDTLNYLQSKISGVLGSPESVVCIHGGVHRDERRKIQEMFRQDDHVRVLVATDAAGEGINLQNANLMVNYDLPWNPNRLEQRFGRIHRIGQTEVCHLWNLVAKETREGDVYTRLLTKLETESKAFKGRIFDILGKVLEEESLQDLLIEAIRYGDRPEVRAKLSRKIDNAFDMKHVKELVDRDALASETMNAERLFNIKEEMERAEARRLQPFFVRSFFTDAFKSLGGSIYQREKDRFEITHVPTIIRERDRIISGRNRRETAPVLSRYERVCFTKEAVRPMTLRGAVLAQMLHPGHPLMLAVSDLVLEKYANLLRQGAVLVDTTDDGQDAHLLFMLSHEIKSGDGQVISRRMQFVNVAPDGRATFAGWAPHLDLEPLKDGQMSLLKSVMQAPWIRADLETKALALAAGNLVPEHFKEVADRRIATVDKTLNAVNERLTAEISYWSDRWIRLDEDRQAGKDVGPNLDNIKRTINDLSGRLESRKKELQAMRQIVNCTPVAMGGALIVPAGLLRKLEGETETPVGTFSADAAARSRIERIAMDAVRKAEEAHGCRVEDVSAQKCGWDITSYPPAVENRQPETRHIEVKGRIKGATTVTLSRNELLYALNQSDKFKLAIVLVGENDVAEGPFYCTCPITKEPDFGVSSVNYDLGQLLKAANSY
jgi:SNF2 family DNA or RNA helicase